MEFLEGFQTLKTKKISFNKEKNIGKVLIIVEGKKTEPFLLRKIFSGLFDFQCEIYDRTEKYKKYNKKEDILSSIFVINTKESAISHIDNYAYLETIFEKLYNDYKFPVERASIFYIFDRDIKSNTDSKFIENLISSLSNSRENKDYRPGLFLLSYPCIESFVASNFISNSFELEFEKGEDDLKIYLETKKINPCRICEDSLKLAVEEMEKMLCEIGIAEHDLDDFAPENLKVFNFQEQFYSQKNKYKLLSLLSIVLLDLGMVQIEEVENTD